MESIEETAFGLLARVPIDRTLEALAGELHPQEHRHLETLDGVRRRTWLAGRIAMRRAARRLGETCDAILTDERGAPVLPGALRGSIAHKESIAVALAVRSDTRDGEFFLGVDVEHDRPPRVDIARRVLRDEELEALARIDEPNRGRAVRVAFCVKEAIYKAIDPVCRRYVGFREVTLDIGACADERAGPVDAELILSTAPERRMSVRASFIRSGTQPDERILLAMAEATLL